MKRGPKPGAKRIPRSVENMRAAWGEDAPDWIDILAVECDRASQRKVAEIVGYSAAAISNVLKKRYGIDGRGGDLGAVEQAVRGAFMNAVLDCPELGEMSTHACLDWQKKARTFANVNPLRVRMYRACRQCPHSRFERETGGARC